MSVNERLVAIEMHFRHTGDGEYPYSAELDGATVLIGVNDFPAEPLYSVYVDGEPFCDLEDWPVAWTKDGIPDHLLDLIRDDPRGIRIIEECDRVDRTDPIEP